MENEEAIQNINKFKVQGKMALLQESDSAYSIDIGGMRIKYKQKHELLTEESLQSKDPFQLFRIWFEEACKTPEILEANAMCIATATKEGLPSVRPVLMKGYGSDGFKFFTNYASRKGQELQENPHAALLFYWEVLKRCIRIEGNVEKLPEEESEQYFRSRPKESQIGACCSNQSQVIRDRTVLETRETELKMKYKEDDAIIPKPKNWGGYRVVPKTFEFWQGQSDRLHDRILFRQLASGETLTSSIHQGENGWVYERLSP